MTGMANAIYVKLPVADLERSTAFFEALGFPLDLRFTDQTAACVVLGEGIHALLMAPELFESYVDKPAIDASGGSEAILSLGLDSREEVTALCERAFALGARRYKEPDDDGFLFGWGFEDLDGHVWECFWVEPVRGSTITAR